MALLAHGQSLSSFGYRSSSKPENALRCNFSGFSSETSKASHNHRIDERGAKLGHIVSVGNMVERSITLGRTVPLFD